MLGMDDLRASAADRADCSICDRAVTLRAVGTLLLKAY
jgi:hypothetical protein